MWYLAEILFAEPDDPARADYQCEACSVVFRAADAGEAHRRAAAWGLAHAAEPPSGVRLLGVSHLASIGEELGDGTEVCGRFFQVPAEGGRLPDLVPSPHELKAVRWEQVGGTPLGELLTAEQVVQLRKAWGLDAEPPAAPDRGGRS